jgi:DNA-binding IscR family transcriptional regulator
MIQDSIENLMKTEEIIRLTKSATASFRHCLTQDELENCIYHALWRACSKYNEELNDCKFSSYLYNGVLMECMSVKRSNEKRFFSNTKRSLKHSKSSYSSNDHIDMMDEINNCADPSIIFDRYYNNMTIKEIAKTNNISRELVRRKINKNLKMMKRNLTGGV